MPPIFDLPISPREWPFVPFLVWIFLAMVARTIVLTGTRPGRLVAKIPPLAWVVSFVLCLLPAVISLCATFIAEGGRAEIGRYGF